MNNIWSFYVTSIHQPNKSMKAKTVCHHNSLEIMICGSIHSRLECMEPQITIAPLYYTLCISNLATYSLSFWLGKLVAALFKQA